MSDKPNQQHFGEKDGVEKTRDPSPGEKAIRKLAAELGVTPAAAALVMRTRAFEKQVVVRESTPRR